MAAPPPKKVAPPSFMRQDSVIGCFPRLPQEAKREGSMMNSRKKKGNLMGLSLGASEDDLYAPSISASVVTDNDDDDDDIFGMMEGAAGAMESEDEPGESDNGNVGVIADNDDDDDDVFGMLADAAGAIDEEDGEDDDDEEDDDVFGDLADAAVAMSSDGENESVALASKRNNDRDVIDNDDDDDVFGLLAEAAGAMEEEEGDEDEGVVATAKRSGQSSEGKALSVITADAGGVDDSIFDLLKEAAEAADEEIDDAIFDTLKEAVTASDES